MICVSHTVMFYVFLNTRFSRAVIDSTYFGLHTNFAGELCLLRGSCLSVFSNVSSYSYIEAPVSNSYSQFFHGRLVRSCSPKMLCILLEYSKSK